MELQQIIEEINQIFIELFGDNSIRLNEFSTTDDVAAWDSLNHIQVITAVEAHYHISFELNELLNFNNIGDMGRSVQQKLH